MHTSQMLLFVMKEVDPLLPMEPKAQSNQNNQAYPSERKIHLSKENSLIETNASLEGVGKC